MLIEIDTGTCNSSLWRKQTAIASWKRRSVRYAPMRRLQAILLRISTTPTPSMAMEAWQMSSFYTTNCTMSALASGNTHSAHSQRVRATMSIWKLKALLRPSVADNGTAWVLAKTYALRRRAWKSHNGPWRYLCLWLAGWVNYYALKVIFIHLGSAIILNTAGDAAAVPPTRNATSTTLYINIFLSSLPVWFIYSLTSSLCY